ncbi:MAG: CGNR zinc finger domain-containing protein [Nocardioides sp.]|nr:CGNR zinc finger domain-containing protein [Nocardioides sp.]
MTGQVQFDSHVLHLLETTVALVNAVTPGTAGGRPRGVLASADLGAAVAGAVHVDTVEAADAEHLAELAGRARQVVQAVADHDPDRAAGIVNVLLLETGARPQLDPAAAGGWALHFHGPDDTLARGWAAGIAAGLAVALGSGLGGRLGVCDAAGCDRIYLDVSRNSGRRFCSPRCQSRTKAAAHRERSR